MRHRPEEGRGGRTSREVALSNAVVSLLRGVLERDGPGGSWADLLRERGAVQDHLRVLGLELVVDEADGYAFVRSAAGDDADASSALPRLVRRQPLPYGVSLLLALFRKRLAELDARGGETRLVLREGEVVEMVETFLPAGGNQAKRVREVQADLQKIARLGFIRRVGGGGATPGGPAVEVRRHIKAFVDAQWLAGFDQRLAEYAARDGGGAAAPGVKPAPAGGTAGD